MKIPICSYRFDLAEYVVKARMERQVSCQMVERFCAIGVFPVISIFVCSECISSSVFLESLFLSDSQSEEKSPTEHASGWSLSQDSYGTYVSDGVAVPLLPRA